MSVGAQLFVRGLTATDMADIWDDTQLVKAYDKAIKSYKPADMAKRIAMGINASANGRKSKPKWRTGSVCRAVYVGDGEEYEAYIVDVLNKERCTVRFVGYGDDATVKLSDLKPSHGTAARSEQVYNITTEPSWKEILKSDLGVEDSALDSASEFETVRDVARATAETGNTSTHLSDEGRRKKNKGKKRKHHHTRTPQLDSLLSLDAQSKMTTVGPFVPGFPGTLEMPPLPPILPPGDMDDDEQELLNNMLTSWYMSGYYAGVYQTSMKKKSKKSPARVAFEQDYKYDID